ncbi:Hypothetical predicted protein [Octopus vulgaris]|uniref:Uncharacterized protein n=1 Tax=Octopus vulgaris TaxID=6645 RepID=A0AA36BAZ7_OCTVU|nr:Hypothetical predicted protein [Octopus vulgaris]
MTRADSTLKLLFEFQNDLRKLVCDSSPYAYNCVITLKEYFKMYTALEEMLSYHCDPYALYPQRIPLANDEGLWTLQNQVHKCQDNDICITYNTITTANSVNSKP